MRQAIIVMNKHKNKEDIKLVYRLIRNFKLLFSNEFTCNDWLKNIDCYGLLGNINNMLKNMRIN